MVTKIFVSGISASQEVRKKQQRILFILESLKIEHEVVDITEPGREEEKAIIKEECAKHEKTNTLPPQIFSDDEYLGDYSDFENATENDNILGFLKLPAKTIDNSSKTTSNGVENGDRVTEIVTADDVNEEA